MDIAKILKDLRSAERDMVRAYERGDRVGGPIKDLRSAIKALDARQRDLDRTPAKPAKAKAPKADEPKAD